MISAQFLKELGALLRLVFDPLAVVLQNAVDLLLDERKIACLAALFAAHCSYSPHTILYSRTQTENSSHHVDCEMSR